MCKIVVVGSLNMDLVINADRRPDVGETILGNSFNIFCGGKGFNQAVAASRLGAQVDMIGMVGDDDFGRQFINALKSQNIGIDNIFISENTKTGIGSPVIDKNGNNSIIVVPGANMDIGAWHIEKAKQSLLSADLIMLQLEIPLAANLAVAKMAHGANIPVFLNPAPFAELPKELLSMITFFIPNEVECEKFTGVKVVDEDSAGKAAAILFENGISNVVVTMGEKGSYIDDGSVSMQIPSYHVKVIDTTAAGDAFCAAFAFHWAKHGSLEKAANYANAVGALTTTRLGAEPSLPGFQEVQEFLQERNNL